MYKLTLPYWFLFVVIICIISTAVSSGVLDQEESQQSEFDDPLQPSFIPELDFAKNIPKHVRAAEAAYGLEQCSRDCDNMYFTLSCMSSINLDGTSVQSLESNAIKGCPTADKCYCCTKCGSGGQNSGCMTQAQTVELKPSNCIMSGVTPTNVIHLKSVDKLFHTFDKIQDETQVLPLQSQIVKLDWPVEI